jgi:hypothetical protein
MSGGQIPYQLRANKFIDRQLFVELLGRVLPKVGNEKYLYISMGGKHLVDHRVVYRQLGISNLFSFDRDGEIVDRQKFNKPTNDALCEEMSSGSLPARIDELLVAFDGVTNLVVWLDFTDPHARRTQLQELIQVLGKLQPDDILRITLNANIRTLDETPDSWRMEGYRKVQEYRLDRLKKQLSDLVPTDLSAIEADEFPLALTRCVGLAVSKAESQSEDVRFVPELVTTYKDGQRMLTVTIRAVSAEDMSEAHKDLKNWKFKASNWSDMTNIEAPDLSSKERLKIDQYLHKPPSYILDRLKFLPAKNRKSSLKVIRSYKLLHRYYPEFRHIEAG